VNLRRGFLRLAISLGVLWFVYWTFAYVLGIRHSENQPISGGPLAWQTVLAVIAAAAVALAWIVSGLRQTRYAGVVRDGSK